jgi:cobalamin biosynthesis protein CobD/CbiB
MSMFGKREWKTQFLSIAGDTLGCLPRLVGLVIGILIFWWCLRPVAKADDFSEYLQRHLFTHFPPLWYSILQGLVFLVLFCSYCIACYALAYVSFVFRPFTSTAILVACMFSSTFGSLDFAWSWCLALAGWGLQLLIFRKSLKDFSSRPLQTKRRGV